MGSTDKKDKKDKKNSKKDECWEPEKHPKHMCKLLKRGLMEEIDKRSVKPTVRCAKCRAEADLPEMVCQPIEL